MKKLIYKFKYKLLISIFAEYTVFESNKVASEVTAFDLLEFLDKKINIK